MAMKYYLSYGIPSKEGMPAQPVMQVMAYDDANGIRYLGKTSVLIYHGSRIVSKLFQSVHAALRDLQTYGKPVLLPNGEEVRPVVYNGYEDESPFISWLDVKGERWPGEPHQRR